MQRTLSIGEDLQAAINAAQPGDTLLLPALGRWDGSYTLPPRPRDGATITLRTTTSDAELRGCPRGSEDTDLRPVIAAGGEAPVFRTLPGAHNWRLVGLTLIGRGDLVVLGSHLQALEDAPGGLVLDRCWIHGLNAKRGVQLNSAQTTITACRIDGALRPASSGSETQAIAGWNGPGPFTIEDCYIEAGSIGVLFGGSRPSIEGLIPSDITFRRNLVTRSPDLRAGQWGVKNLFELKSARRVLIEGNLFEHNWTQAQSGYAIVFTVRARSMAAEIPATWSTIEDVVFTHNIVRRVGAGFNILGRDDAGGVVSGVMRNVRIVNNLLIDIGGDWSGPGFGFLIGGGPEDLAIERNTLLQGAHVLAVNGLVCPRFRFAGNAVRHNTYGIFGDNAGTGNPAIARYFPDGEVTANVFGGGLSRLYPPGNSFLASSEDLIARFQNAALGDYRLPSFAPPVGCDVDALEAARLPVVIPPPPPDPDPDPELIVTIVNRLADAAFEACDQFDGTVSPQDAARIAVSRLRDALLAEVS